MAKISIFSFGSRVSVNLLIELNILVPNLIGFEEKLYVKFFAPKDIYYHVEGVWNFFYSVIERTGYYASMMRG